MNKNTKDEIIEELLNSVKNTIKRTDKKLKEESYRPFHSKLLTDEMVRLSKFERSFSTSLGQRGFEKISKIICKSQKDIEFVENQKKTIISLSEKTSASIESHIKLLRENKLDRKVQWDEDYKSIIIDDKKIVEHRIISDLWFKKSGIDYYFSIKTVMPNIDQTAEAKRDLLKLKSSNPSCQAYFALPYNPFGEERKLYNHTPPFKIFDMHNDSCVLIGEEYWDFIGGKGTYNELMKVTEIAGKKTTKLLEKW